MPHQHLHVCRLVHNTHHQRLMFRHDVMGTAVGFRRRNGKNTGQPVVTIFVSRKLPSDMVRGASRLPGRLTYGSLEVETDVVEQEAPSVPLAHDAGIAVPTPTLPDLAIERRPIVGGASIAHWHFPVGTVTAGVVDLIGGRRCVLSCNHVLARLNGGHFGDPVLQPAPDDGGWYPREAAAALLRYVPVHFDGTPNHVDAAIAACWPGDISNVVEGVGEVHESVSPDTLLPGDKVMKVGRSTGLTYGTVVYVDAAVKPNYGPLGFSDRSVQFVNQIVADIPANVGDSGSILVDSRGRAVGMLFGGLPHRSWFNPFTEIERRLGVSLLPRQHVWV